MNAKHPQRRWLGSYCLWVGALLLPGIVRAEGPDFERQIAPLLIQNCLRCHNSSDPAGELDLTSRAKAFGAGDSGQAAVVPGKPAESYLLDRVRDGEMPPPEKSPPLTPEAAELLTQWIESGASWPEERVLSLFDVSTDARAGRDWWSLGPVTRPAVPNVKQSDWVRTPLDAFVLARLEERGLHPSPEADRATLIRRATFDLWGLPPDPDEVARFVADPAADAYERLIDRLLASPNYGERWGQHWLDVVRYGESNGYETNGKRPNSWPYRDYVIKAFNRDIPYPQFIREQLVGDQLGVAAATGFLVAGAHDVVGSPDIELTRQQRSNDLDDFVSTTSQAFMALTVSCARCHDHKFDPIYQRDYYGLQAVFSGVFHGERDVPIKLTPEAEQQQAKLRDELAAVERQIRTLAAQHEPLARLGAAQPGAPLRSAVHPLGNIDRFAPIKARYVRFTALATHQGEPCLDELEVFAADDGRNVALASGGAKASASGVLGGGTLPIHQTAHINDGKYGNSFSWIPDQLAGAWIEIELPEAVVVDRVEWARDRQAQFFDRVAVGYRIEVAETPGQWQAVATSEDRRPFASAQGPPESAAGGDSPTAAELAQLRKEADKLRASIQTTGAQRMYVGVFGGTQPVQRLHRGEVMQPREEIPPATPKLIGAPLEIAPNASDAERRTAVAGWLADPSHSLVNRVFVNRVWYYHFGRGLVRSPSDFGFNGGLPSHPELLDWLASDFVDHESRPKHLHRQILLSATYRQSSRLDKHASDIDGGNELLWRYRPRRLEAEPIHDTILAVSGTLESARGGPGFDVFLPDASNVKVYEPKPTLGPSEWRRMIYQHKPRMRAEPTFGVFDCPDASASMARRNVSTTALQSLNLLNSPFMTQQSALFAQRLERERPADVPGQIRRAFWLAFAREPAADELAAAEQLVATEGLAQLCRAIYNANEFVYVR